MKRIIYLGIAILVVIALWTGAWFFIAAQLRSNVLLLADADGIDTPRLTCKGLDIGGYPFHFNLDCEGAKLVSGDIAIDIAGVRAAVQVYQPTFLLASVRGPVDIEDSFTGSRSQVSFSGLQASIRTDWLRLARLSLVADDVVWNDTLAGTNLIASSPKVEFHLLDIPEQHDATTGRAALALYTEAHDAIIPGFTIADGTASIQAELSGLPDDIRKLVEPNLLQEVQHAGGKLKIVSISATDGATSTFDATGEMSLDPQGLLEGNAAITSKGVVERIGGLIEEPFRTLVLGNPDATGTYTQNLTARGGTIYSGIIPAGAVPPLF